MRILNIGLALAIAYVATACAPPPSKSGGPTPFDKTVKADCYTVDMFTSTKVKPHDDGVPAEWRRFAGAWGGGAWEGKWCHDLYVTGIKPNGDVDLIETHAPYPEWGREATAFKRIGKIDEDGRLRFRSRGVAMEYWVKDGRLLGLRKEGSAVMRIKLSPKSEV